MFGKVIDRARRLVQEYRLRAKARSLRHRNSVIPPLGEKNWHDASDRG